jgi:hypothetical protein
MTGADSLTVCRKAIIQSRQRVIQTQIFIAGFSGLFFRDQWSLAANLKVREWLGMESGAI